MSTAPLVLCAVDFSPASRPAVEQALGWAAALGAELCLVHVYEAPHYVHPGLLAQGDEGGPRPLSEIARAQAERAMTELLASIEDDQQVAIQTELQNGVPARVLVELADKRRPELLVLGRHGHGLWGRLVLGSVAEKVVRLASCPVLTLPPPPKAEVGSG